MDPIASGPVLEPASGSYLQPSPSEPVFFPVSSAGIAVAPRRAKVAVRNTGRAAIRGSAGVALFAALATIGFRLHELVPLVANVLRPAMFLGPLAVVLMLRQAKVPCSAVVKRSFLLRALLALAVFAAIGVPFALLRGFAFARLQGLLPLFLLFLAFSLAKPSSADVKRAITMFVILGGLLGTAAILLGHSDSSGRVSVTYTLDSNDLAAVLAMVVPLACGLVFSGSVYQRVGAVIAVAICSWAIVRTGSRGGVVGLGVGLLVFVLIQRGSMRMISLAVLSLAMVVGWQFAPHSFRERMASLASLEADYNTTSYFGRKEIWSRGIGYGLSNPVMGVGIGNFEAAEGSTLEEMGRRGKWSAAHNSFIQVFSEMGFPGLIIFSLILGRCLLVAWRWRSPRVFYPSEPSSYPGLLGAVTAFTVAAFFVSGAFSWAFFALCGLMSVADLSSNREGMTPPRRTGRATLAPLLRKGARIGKHKRPY